MKKQIIVENCYECPFFRVIRINNHTEKWPRKGQCDVKEGEYALFDKWDMVQPWCPLETVEGE